MRVVCPLCEKQYESILRKCPDCGQVNEACTAKYELFQVELDGAVLFTFRQLAKGKEAEKFQEAVEEWIDKHGEGKK